MDERYGGSCDIVQAAFGLPNDCCSACHEDADYDGMGYQLLEIYLGAQWFSVCCITHVNWDKFKEGLHDNEYERSGNP